MRPTLAPETITAAITQHIRAREDLISAYPDLDDDTLQDTLEGLTDATDIIGAVIRSSLEDAALLEALSTRLSDMKARRDRLEDRMRTKREIARKAMTAAGIHKLTHPDFTASLRTGAASLEVENPALVPAAYLKPQPPTLDRQGLLAALKAGITIDGVALKAPTPQLNVRTK
ncbi:MAG: siphovirus Gp157 family protein [Hyphomicrobiaceae bacterium]